MFAMWIIEKLGYTQVILKSLSFRKDADFKSINECIIKFIDRGTSVFIRALKVDEF